MELVIIDASVLINGIPLRLLPRGSLPYPFFKVSSVMVRTCYVENK